MTEYKDTDERYAGMKNWSLMDQLATRNRTIADIRHIIKHRSTYFETIWPFGEERKYGGIYKMENIELEAAAFCKEKGKTIEQMLFEIYQENARAMAYCLSSGGCWAVWQLYEAIAFERAFTKYLYKHAYTAHGKSLITPKDKPLWDYSRLDYSELAAIWHISQQSWENMC